MFYRTIVKYLTRMKKSALLFCSVWALSAVAAPVTPKQALSRLQSSDRLRVANISQQSMQLANISEMPSLTYLFHDSDGRFVITPADDCAAPLLGYGTNFDPNNIPPAMVWWLECYSSQVQAIINGRGEAASTPEHPVVEPLVKTKWDQESPYNLLCPSYSEGKCVTGCVATAMAQVLNYHQWPRTTGIGTYSYVWGKTKQELSFDYASTTFEWGKMLDTYEYQNSSTESIYAVATLMYACGVALQMNYGVNESGAKPRNQTRALIENFGYDCGASYHLAEYFSLTEWDEIIYNEISSKRPVLYGGRSEEGGHSFICDGYAGSGYYHINWGWGGSSDGYFKLSALNPYEQGTGGSSPGLGYNSQQDIVIGIQPPVEGSVPQVPLFVTGSIQGDDNSGYINFGVYDPDQGIYSGFYSYYGATLKYEIAMKLTQTLTGNIYYAPITTTDLEPNYGFSRVWPNYSSIPTGKYAGTIAARLPERTDWQELPFAVGETSHLTVIVDASGRVTYSDISGIAPIISGENTKMDVYNLQGRLLRSGVDAIHATDNLPSGIYIVGGRKVMVR